MFNFHKQQIASALDSNPFFKILLIQYESRQLYIKCNYYTYIKDFFNQELNPADFAVNITSY